MSEETTEFDPDRVVIRDKRRIDPLSGEVREPVTPAPAAVPPAVPSAVPAPVEAPVEDLAAELTADLQRISAEYANYRKRVDRDRAAVVEIATAGLLSELLPLLDDVDRARQHGDLDGAFKSVGEGIEAVATKLGLERFGESGEPFDPAVHEALMQAEPNPTATVATCAQVFSPGYRLTSGRVLRPARVSVAEPGAAAPVVPPAGPEVLGQ
jgi:molecular chaperone GrpE